MATLITQPGNRRLIQFTDEHRKRRSIRLGKLPLRTAESIKTRVEYLVASQISGVPLDSDTCNWLANLDDRLYQKLAVVNLVEPRASATIGEYLNQYIASRTDLKPASLKKLRQTEAKLLDFFEPNTPLRTISPNDASEWRNVLVREASNSSTDSGDTSHKKLSEATVKQHSGNAKTIFNEAVRRRLIAESPFNHLKSGATASRNTRHVTAAEADAILEACPSIQWRLVFALGRYAGLRVPSESHLLTWSDVDWAKGRLRVRCVKTEHHSGHEVRIVPITDKLMPVLQDAFDAAEPGEERIVTMNHGGQAHRALRRIVERAGVQPWADAFQTLRRSCEKEWAMTYPQYAVSKWIGHSIEVSGRHYANAVPDELFDRASSKAPTPTRNGALQNALQQVAAGRCTAMKSNGAACSKNAETREEFASLQERATPCNNGEQWSRGESNPRADTVSRRLLRA